MIFLRALPPLIVLALTGASCYYIFWSKPEPRKFPKFEVAPKVAVETLRPQSYQVWLNTQGTVQARTESELVSQVRGNVISVSPSFKPGGFFEEGEILMEIDRRDYEMETRISSGQLAQAQLRLSEEEATVAQALADWKRLNLEEEPSDLVLRKPQLNEAKANVDAAEARLELAQLNMERTTIRAPYAGRVLYNQVDFGQYISPGNNLARIYAVDYAEIRLPLNEKQLAYIDLPELYRGESEASVDGPNVTLTWSVGNDEHKWLGKIVRAEGALDTQSRQLFVVAQVENPYAKQADGKPPFKVGSFVQATIEGNLLHNVFVIPREQYRKNEYVLIVDEENKLRRREIVVQWGDDDNLVVSSGIKAGERLCTTPMNFPVDGMTVEIISEDGIPVVTEKSAKFDRSKPPFQTGS
ncbi:MAG: efflux RND transporter periplasmic adaptor subunit [Opitutales bacterium]|nr:efflux RND transporter periplasmic adaptor subunit [Opitutales bacterium]